MMSENHTPDQNNSRITTKKGSSRMAQFILTNRALISDRYNQNIVPITEANLQNLHNLVNQIEEALEEALEEDYNNFDFFTLSLQDIIQVKLWDSIVKTLGAIRTSYAEYFPQNHDILKFVPIVHRGITMQLTEDDIMMQFVTCDNCIQHSVRLNLADASLVYIPLIDISQL